MANAFFNIRSEDYFSDYLSYALFSLSNILSVESNDQAFQTPQSPLIMIVLFDL